MTTPETRYAKVGDDRVAYQVLGDGPRDLVFTTGWWASLDLEWEEPAIARFLRRMASFSRVIRFSARGSGLSDARPKDGRDACLYWTEDLLAVMNAARSNTTALFAMTNGGSMAIRFAVAHPERVSALVLLNTTACWVASADYPAGFPPEELAGFSRFARKHFGTERFARVHNPSLDQDERALSRQAKYARAIASPKAVAEIFEIELERDVRPDLCAVRMPTLVMTRHNCLWASLPQGRYIAENVVGARFEELPGSDSLPYWEAPDLILDHVEEFLTGNRRGAESDRALAAVLFTDIVDSTKHAADLGDAAWRELQDRHEEILREQIGLFRGRLVDTAGDGVLAVFERPDRAIECAQALHTALASLKLSIRAGIHFGDVELRNDGQVGGMTVHIGARVQALAKAGEVLVSRTVHDVLVGSRFNFVGRGEYELKGVPGRWEVCEVVERLDPTGTL
ncbi:adenylate/guanylate cyclase domain-containing protein [Variovorax sp. J22P240]|uniref:adenylate/guanylate cyclase domain-containing protein n=1 Tax=Variovorax sp. J22P240 TaxID=3053514 RepID=UPI0025777118|nr:adenylate/guanylate cyclase domain-containing protein [Variovorax sp. J22P240]MDM0001860.1 adenylate/guanylate cyclase domain-containing protein [Variovorax sp. J22P240]